MEARFYYYGLPSRPLLVARTTTNPWKAPTGPEAYAEIKMLYPVGPHALDELWEDNVAFKIHHCLDAMKVKWTSTDVVRASTEGSDLKSAPVFLWIGVVPQSLSPDEGLIVASQCQKILDENNLADVGVEIRESVVTRSAGPKLLRPLPGPYVFDPTIDIREPLTTTLALSICAHNTPWAEGNGGFFVGEGDKPGRLLLVTARHVVFPPRKGMNTRYEYRNNSWPRQNVALFGDKSHENYQEFMKREIENAGHMVQRLNERISRLQGTPESDLERQRALAQLDKARTTMETLEKFQLDFSTHWSTLDDRTIGHVVLSPPLALGVGPEGYREDWAVIEIDPSKVDESNFIGNIIDLGTRIDSYDFSKWMHPNHMNHPSFEYPDDRLLQLNDIIPKEDIHCPMAADQNDGPSLRVIKRGAATGITVGCANTLCSYTRDYNGYPGTAKEWAILQRSARSGPFSAPGDSGSVVVDGRGRIGGLITGGAGNTGSLDITYATPAYFILERMAEEALCEPNVNPDLGI